MIHGIENKIEAMPGYMLWRFFPLGMIVEYKQPSL